LKDLVFGSVFRRNHKSHGWSQFVVRVKGRSVAIFDAATLHTKEDWIRAGEIVFSAGTAYEVPMMDLRAVSDPAWYARIRIVEAVWIRWRFQGIQIEREG
jgi:hypothetical protein